jgi:hypothetical protein
VNPEKNRHQPAEFLKSTQTLRILLRIMYFCWNIARKWQMVDEFGWNYYK